MPLCLGKTTRTKKDCLDFSNNLTCKSLQKIPAGDSIPKLNPTKLVSGIGLFFLICIQFYCHNAVEEKINKAKNKNGFCSNSAEDFLFFPIYF